jgi:phage baseplate assembly protein W
MFVVNNVPSNNDSKLVKTLAFPFQLGSSGFPATEKSSNKAYVAIVALLTTAPWERVMNVEMGVNVYKYIFENMTAIQRARLASEVTSAIEAYIPGVSVDRVSYYDLSTVDSSKEGTVFDIEYTVAGQSSRVMVPGPARSNGV